MKEKKGELHSSLFLPPIWWWWCHAVERDFYQRNHRKKEEQEEQQNATAFVLRSFTSRSLKRVFFWWYWARLWCRKILNFPPLGWKGKNNNRSLLHRHLSRRFRTSDGRREVRWTHAAFSFLIRSSWLSSSRSRVRIVCVCYALQSTTTVDEFKTPFCFFLLQHSLWSRM